MKISDAEAAVAEHWGKSDREFSFAAEQLVQSLLSSFQVETGRGRTVLEGNHDQASSEHSLGGHILGGGRSIGILSAKRRAAEQTSYNDENGGAFHGTLIISTGVAT